MSEQVNILGVKIDKVTVDSAAGQILDWAGQPLGRSRAVCTPNSEILMMAYRDGKLRDVLNRADMRTADGIGVVYAAKIVKNPLAGRAAGYDVACSLLEKLGRRGGSVYLFGSKPGVAEAAAGNMRERYPGLVVAGCADGYFDAEKEQKIIADINEKQPDVLFVCLGAPKQEIWIDQNRDKLAVKVCMGLGGSLDVFAGNVKRAPAVFQKLGLEWLYRLCKEPKRIGRMMDLPRFGMTVLLHGRKFPQEGQKT